MLVEDNDVVILFLMILLIIFGIEVMSEGWYNKKNEGKWYEGKYEANLFTENDNGSDI